MFVYGAGRGSEPGPQRDPEPLLCHQGRAEGHVGEGQAQRAGHHPLVPPHRRDLPLQVVGQPAEPQAVHGSRPNPPHVKRMRLPIIVFLIVFVSNCPATTSIAVELRHVFC